jgi:hypothetical protein
MPYKVFISHSTRDQGLVIALANLLAKYGADVSVAEWSLAPGERLDKKVLARIENSDCVAVLLTANGVRQTWVQQEIVFALNSKKPVIPLVEKGIDPKDLGALQRKEYIQYDPEHPREALVRTATYVRSLRLKKEEQEKALLIAGGIMAFLLLLHGSRN